MYINYRTGGKSGYNLLYIPNEMAWRLFDDYDHAFHARLMIEYGDKVLKLADSSMLVCQYEVCSAEVMELYDCVISESLRILTRDKTDFLDLADIYDEILADISFSWVEKVDDVPELEAEDDEIAHDMKQYLESLLCKEDDASSDL